MKILETEIPKYNMLSPLTEISVYLKKRRFNNYMRCWVVPFLMLMSGAGNVSAQSAINFDPPDLKLMDGAGINLVSGQPNVHTEPVSIGSPENGLVFKLDFNGRATNLDLSDGFGGEISSNWVWEGYQSESINLEVRLFNTSDFFRMSDSSNRRHTGSKISLLNDGSYEYISRNGVRYITDPNIAGRGGTVNKVNMAITKVVYPDGRILQIRRHARVGTPVQTGRFQESSATLG